VIKFSAIQAKIKINSNQVCTKLHSIGSHNGSSSVTQASIKKIINKPRKYKKPSAIVLL